MQPFGYVEPSSRPEALRMAREHPGARFLAGGTTLIDLMKSGVMHPSLLIDVNRLPGMNAIELVGDVLHVGALARMSDVASHPLIRENAPGISESLLFAASGQLRNMASIGGNLLQRTRCLYFRDRHFPCNKRAPGTGCGAIGGENRNLAVLGTSESCIANYPGDFAVMFAALEGSVLIDGPNGERIVAARDFHRSPGDTPDIETVLSEGEIVTGISIPTGGLSRQSHYLKVRDRSSYEYASVSVAVAAEFADNGTFGDVRMALGGLAAKPWVVDDVGDILKGASADNDRVLDELASWALESSRPQPGNAYKVPQARAAIRRAWKTLAQRYSGVRA